MSKSGYVPAMDVRAELNDVKRQLVVALEENSFHRAGLVENIREDIIAQTLMWLERRSTIAHLMKAQTKSRLDCMLEMWDELNELEQRRYQSQAAAFQAVVKLQVSSEV